MAVNNTRRIVHLPTTSTSDRQLEVLANELNIPVKVYMNDEIRDGGVKLHVNSASIINLQSSSFAGTHWVCCVDVSGQRNYFDSFAGYPSDNVLNYLTLPKTSIKRSFAVVQAFDSQDCGSLCLFVIQKLFTGQNYGTVLLFLQQKLENNDRSPLWISVLHSPKN